MRAIILAAGLDSRLKEYTAGKPNCLLEFGAKTLLQRQMESLAANGITDIHLVRGYLGEEIAYEGITYHENPDFRDNNILNSLFYAEITVEGNVIVAYSDILFSPEIIEQLLKSDHDISIVVDIDWRGYYFGRKEHPIEEAEMVILDAALPAHRRGPAPGCGSRSCIIDGRRCAAARTACRARLEDTAAMTAKSIKHKFVTALGDGADAT